jgi:hypothetical protein
MTHRLFPLRPTSPPRIKATAETLRAIELEKGFRLPPSYNEFASKFGWGRTGELLLIFIPKRGADSLMGRSRDLKSVVEQSVTEDLFEYEPHGSATLVRRLIPFGISENGHILAWHPDEVDRHGECWIYVIGSKCLSVQRVASDLFTFIESCLDDRVKEVLGSGYTPLKAIFEPLA